METDEIDLDSERHPYPIHPNPQATPSTPAVGSPYGFRPRISLTPHGRAQQECQSLASARRNNSQPQEVQTALGTDLATLEATLGGAISTQDLEDMIAVDISRDLSPPLQARETPSSSIPSLICMDFPNSGLRLVLTSSPRMKKELSKHSSRRTLRVPLVVDLQTRLEEFIDSLIRKASEETKRSPESILSLWHQGRALGRLKKSYWNKYQAYFANNAKEERKRIGNPDAGGQCV